MSLLTLEHVAKRSASRHGRPLLEDVSLDLERAELAAVWGPRRSGRSTLLRIAAGIEPPDNGIVRFEGRDLAERAEPPLGEGIGYVQKTLRGTQAKNALEEVMLSLLARGIPRDVAATRARGALDRTGAIQCAGEASCRLDTAESLRVALARTLVLSPRLVVVDEPVGGVELTERDDILLLLRSLADEGIAVLASFGEATGLTGADRAFALSDGRLRGAPPPKLAEVLPLRRSA